MSETAKTLADLLTSYADNSTGNITGQTYKDAFFSTFNVGGIMSVVDNSTSQSLLSATETDVNQFDLSKNIFGEVVESDAADIGQYTCLIGGTYLVEVSFEFTGASATDHKFTIKKNSTAQGSRTFKGDGSNLVQVHASLVVAAVATDTISLKVEASGASTFLIKNGHYRIQKIG